MRIRKKVHEDYYELIKKRCECGNTMFRVVCSQQNNLTHVCTRIKGHNGEHHSHLAVNIPYSSWKNNKKEKNEKEAQTTEKTKILNI